MIINIIFYKILIYLAASYHQIRFHAETKFSILHTQEILQIRYSSIYLVINHSRTPVIRNLVFRIAIYPNRLGLSVKFVNNSTKLTCLDITGYGLRYSAVLWLLEPQIRRGREVQTQVHTVNSNSRNSYCQMQPIYKEKSNYPDFLHIRMPCRPN